MIGEDIHEGKKTLMVVHAIQTQTSEVKKAKLLETLNKKTKTEEEVIEAISIIQETDSITYAKDYASEMLEKAWYDIETEIP